MLADGVKYAHQKRLQNVKSYPKQKKTNKYMYKKNRIRHRFDAYLTYSVFRLTTVENGS